ncbi:polysulfide reductase, partial [Eggerthella sp. HF-4214]|nr:polysulfide reductase [Eggerthella guodeyinii]
MTENASAASAVKAPAAKFGGKGLTIAIAVAAIITVAGLALWVFQLTGGMVNTN